MPRSAETLSNLPDYSQIKKAPSRAKVINLLQQAHQLKQTISEADERLKEIKSELSQIQLMNDLPGLRYDKYCFIAIEREGKNSLSKELLIDNNVPIEIIMASMKRGNSYIETRLELLEEK